MTQPPNESSQQRLNPWVKHIRRLPESLHSPVIAHFRRRVEAEGHLQALRHTLPEAKFEVLWDGSEDYSQP